LAGTVALQRFETVRRWNPQVIKTLRRVKHAQLSSRYGLNLGS
jgi:hypothetical protein